MTRSTANVRHRLKSSSLRKTLRSSALYWRVRLFLKRITGREIWIRRDIHVSASGNGDYRYDASSLDDTAIVYSFGVGSSVAFELELIEEFGVTVHAFDPTPYTMKWIDTADIPEQLKFYPWAVAGRDGELKLYPRLRRGGQRSDVIWTTDSKQADTERVVRAPAYCIPSLMRKLGHDKIDLLKMDVEGAEYDVLSAMLKMKVYPEQILVEFHHRFPSIGRRRTMDILHDLRASGYLVSWVSRTGREVCLTRR